MNEDEWDALEATFDENGHATDESILYIKGLINENGESSQLIDILADMHELYNGKDESILSFNVHELRVKAIELDPDNPFAHESMGYHQDIFLDNQQAAKKSFETAIKLDPTLVEAFCGLARTSTELGEADYALNILDSYDGEDKERIEEMRKEIKSGLWDPRN